MYGKAGLKEEDNSALHVIQCKPPDSVIAIDPEAQKYFRENAHAIEHCRKAHVDPMLRIRPWTRVDTFGDAPLRYILARNSGITTWRGSILTLPGLGPIAIPTFHPRYIAKDQAMFPVAINDLRKTLEVDPEHYNIYPTIEDVKKFTATKFAFDIETAGWTKEIALVGLCCEDFKVIVVPFIGAYVDELRRIFANAKEVIGQNLIQFDLPVLAHNGIRIPKPKDCMVWDTMLMHHLRFPVFPHDLEFIGKQFTNKGAWKADKVSYETYCARDVDVTWRSFAALQSLLEQAQLTDIYKFVSWPLAKICKLMTETGLHRSSRRIVTLREELAEIIKVQEGLLPGHLRTYTKPKNKRIPAPAGTLSPKGTPVKTITTVIEETVVPWQSPLVKMKFLYEELRDKKDRPLPMQYHIKTKNPTCDKNALDKLYVRFKLPELRALKELNRCSTLLKNFAKEDLKVDDTLHPSFNVHGTAPGRLSSSGPNIQNQPPIARYAYVPRNETGKIVSCVVPETKILTQNLDWVLASSLKVGDKLVGFDEHLQSGSGKMRSRRFRECVVSNIKEIIKPTFRITTDKGVVECSDCHNWLKKERNCGRNYRWHRTDSLVRGDELSFFITPWDTLTDYEAGWMSGFADGEGWLSNKACVGIGQNNGVALDRALLILDKHGYRYSRRKNVSGCNQINLIGEVFPGLRFLGQFKPIRLMQKVQDAWMGKACRGRAFQAATIQSIEFLGNRIVEAIETSTHTFVANGFMSHNCDFSGIENRLVAFMAKDRKRLKWFEDPKFSEHKYLSSIIEGIPYEEVTKSKDKDSPYAMAKVIVHGSDRLMGAQKIAKQYDIDFDRVKDFQNIWKKEIADTLIWQQAIGNQSARVGYLSNPFGRKIWLWESNSVTKAISFMPQSTAADVIFRAMIALMYERIDWPEEWARKVATIVIPLPEGSLLLAQVHDELLTETETADQVPHLLEVLDKVMTQPWPELNGLSLPIGTAVGNSWGDCE